MKVFRFYEDGGHGWLRVTFLELMGLGIEKDISHYSYIKPSKDGKTIYCYLEEDCDLERFAVAMNAKGKEWKARRYASDRSRIRSYDSYSVVLKTMDNFNYFKGETL